MDHPRTWLTKDALTTLIIGVPALLLVLAAVGFFVAGWYPRNGTVTMRIRVERGTPGETAVVMLATLPMRERAEAVRHGLHSAYAFVARDRELTELIPICDDFETSAPFVDDADFDIIVDTSEVTERQWVTQQARITNAPWIDAAETVSWRTPE